MTRNRGMTLIEVLIAAVMLFVVALGGLSYQYQSVKHKKAAWADMTAMRTGMMVVEDWKGTGGQDLGIANGYDLSEFDDDFVYQNNATWKITIEDLPMYVSLYSTIAEQNEDMGITLKKLVVKVKWRSDYSDGDIDKFSSSIELESYIRSDVQGG